MKDHPLHRHPVPDDPRLARAVELIDAGDAAGLRALLAEDPAVVHARVTGGDDAYARGYFRGPTLLHFVAANPLFEEKPLPGNLAELASALLDAGAEVDAGCGEDGRGTTLGLVASGRLAREHGQQLPLLHLLCDRGADPNRAVYTALAERELDAARALVERGAAVDLAVAAGLGDGRAMQSRWGDATDLDRRKALALAALNAQRRCVEILLDRGVDPNQHNPDGCHAHATPLHNAVSAADPATVVTLVTRGADMRLKDKLWDGDAFGWAQHMGHADVLDVLQLLDAYMPGINAIRTGDTDALGAWLDAHPELVNATLPGNGRTPLHHATDWPGHRPNVGRSIAMLIEAGADPDARVTDMPHTETPLHWAASCDDVEAIDALIDGGADLNPLGAVITGGTPLHDAVVFQQRDAAARLLERGAAYDLFLAAGCGRLGLVEPMFDAEGNLREDAPRIAGHKPDEPADHRINWAFYVAAMAGDVPTLAFLHPKVTQFVALPDGRTAVDQAIENRHPEAEAWLAARGLKTKAQLLGY